MGLMIHNKGEGGSASSGANGKEPIGAVLVCGGGVAGIQASIDLSAAGFRVHLVEHGPAVGGGMARLDKTFPTGDCATCIISPKLVECMRDHNIDTYTMADIVDLEGEAGSFKASVRQRQRYVDIDKCTACGDCTAVCPIDLSSSFDSGIATRKAIDRLYAQAAPNAVFISKKERAPCSSGCPIDRLSRGDARIEGAAQVDGADGGTVAAAGALVDVHVPLTLSDSRLEAAGLAFELHDIGQGVGIDVVIAHAFHELG